MQLLARAKRHFIPGYIWHITHRCHKGEFLLRFSKDRYRYLQRLYRARKRYGLTVLDYMITSNHFPLLVVNDGHRDVIAKSMQLVTGRTGQEYNQRKEGKGYQLREGAGHDKAFPELENGDIGLGNSYFWDVNAE